MFKLKVYVITFFFTVLSFTVKATDVLDIIQKSEIKYKGVASKVAILETGNFKSKQFKRNNNAFGFKRNSRKMYITTKNGYCVYEDVHHSVKDYQMWEHAMIKRHRLHSRSSFLSFLNRVYSKSRNYSAKLDKIKIIETHSKKDSTSLDSIKLFLSLSQSYHNTLVSEKLGILFNPEFIVSQLTPKS